MVVVGVRAAINSSKGYIHFTACLMTKCGERLAELDRMVLRVVTWSHGMSNRVESDSGIRRIAMVRCHCLMRGCCHSLLLGPRDGGQHDVLIPPGHRAVGDDGDEEEEEEDDDDDDGNSNDDDIKSEALTHSHVLLGQRSELLCRTSENKLPAKLNSLSSPHLAS
jgi:hypothetical protein